MSTLDPNQQALETLFDRFQSAARARDLEQYRALTARDVESDDELFEQNSASLAEAQLGLRWLSAEVKGDVAVIAFAIVDAAGREVERSDLTAVAEDGAWRIASL